MAEVRGKLITLAASLMTIYEEELERANQKLQTEVGESWDELEPEGWYDAKFYRLFMDAYKDASPTEDEALVTLGKMIYPKMDKEIGLPEELEDPIDYLVFESEGYSMHLRGPEIKPRQFVKKEPGHVVVRTKMLEQDCKILEGVYMGLMKLSGVHRGKITQTKCIKDGDPYCEFHILWDAD